MSAFLSTAVNFVVPPCACYLLNRMTPAPHAGFIVIASTVAAYAKNAFVEWAHIRVKTLAQKYPGSLAQKYPSSIFQLFNISIMVLLPIVARAIGQRMGYPVPGYIQTFGYFNLTNLAFVTSAILLEFSQSAWNFYPKPK